MIFYANNDLITSFLNFLNLKKKEKKKKKLIIVVWLVLSRLLQRLKRNLFPKRTNIYIYIFVCIICLCGGAKRSWMQRTIANDYKQFACFQVLYRSSKKIPLYSIEGQIGRYEITMLWIDTNTREI